MRLESDLSEALEASIEGRVSDGDFRWSKRRRGMRGNFLQRLSGRIRSGQEN
jgi:hypothetical protein